MIRTAAVSSWGMLDNARAVVQFSKAAVKSAEIALDGIRQGGPKITSDLCKRRPTPHPNWHLDESERQEIPTPQPSWLFCRHKRRLKF